MLLTLNYALASINPDYADPLNVKRSIPILKAINDARIDNDLWSIVYDYGMLENMQLYQTLSLLKI